MNRSTVTLVAVLCTTAAWAPARAQTVETSVVKVPQDIVYKGPSGVVALTPVEMKWASQGGLAAPGMEQLNLVGDPAKPGPYTLRLKFPKGFKIAPHTHPDFREVTILSGTFATGYGEQFDAADLKILPTGSFYTEPANVPHYIEIKEDVVLQVSGMGPSERRFVSRQQAPHATCAGLRWQQGRHWSCRAAQPPRSPSRSARVAGQDRRRCGLRPRSAQ